jgi:hypothetical protein
MDFKQIDWEKQFSPAYGVLRLPPHIIFYRGYVLEHPAVSKRPAYYSGIHVAKTYSEQNGRALGAFTNTRELRLLDIRFMKSLLKELFDTSYKPDNVSTATTLSFGLCSLYHQLQLAKQRYNGTMADALKALQETLKLSLYEQPGVRIAETTNDSETMGFLSIIFKGFIDGFVSPRMATPFHIEKGGVMSPELIIFNPSESSIRKFTRIPQKVPFITLNEIFLSQFGKTISITNTNFSFYVKQNQHGGMNDDGTLPSVEAISEQLDKDPEIRRLFERGVKAGKKWRKNNIFLEEEGPAPTVKIRPFIFP